MGLGVGWLGRGEERLSEVRRVAVPFDRLVEGVRIISGEIEVVDPVDRNLPNDAGRPLREDVVELGVEEPVAVSHQRQQLPGCVGPHLP